MTSFAFGVHTCPDTTARRAAETCHWRPGLAPSALTDRSDVRSMRDGVAEKAQLRWVVVVWESAGGKRAKRAKKSSAKFRVVRCGMDRTDPCWRCSLWGLAGQVRMRII